MFPCMTGVAPRNMKNSLCFIIGIFRCHGHVCYMFLIDAIYCKRYVIDPSNMCVNFENDRLTIDDYRS